MSWGASSRRPTGSRCESSEPTKPVSPPPNISLSAPRLRRARLCSSRSVRCRRPGDHTLAYHRAYLTVRHLNTGVVVFPSRSAALFTGGVLMLGTLVAQETAQAESARPGDGPVTIQSHNRASQLTWVRGDQANEADFS